MYKKCTYKKYKTKHILNVHEHCDGGWFWDKYTAFPYSGCEWGCEYCYWRHGKYNPHKWSDKSELKKYKDPFSEYIKIKEGAPDLLRNALKNKPKDIIYLDNYQPVDAEYGYCGEMLQVCLDLEFPVFVNEKSPMLLRDIDVLKKLSRKSFVNVGWSIITTKDDEKKLAFEPKTPAIAARFEAMKQLSQAGIMTGTVFMPILPFVFDDEENICAVVRKTKECGGQYVLAGGLSLWGYTKTHFYKALRKYDPGLVEKYDKLYESDEGHVEQAGKIHRLVKKYCEKYGLTSHIPRPIDHFPNKLHTNKRIAEHFYLKSRELQFSGESKHREWAYRKAAHALDDLEEDVAGIYKNGGAEGLVEIKNIGESTAEQIVELL